MAHGDWPRTVAEFEPWHARQPERWEFVEGWPRLMAPASIALDHQAQRVPRARWRSRRRAL